MMSRWGNEHEQRAQAMIAYHLFVRKPIHMVNNVFVLDRKRYDIEREMVKVPTGLTVLPTSLKPGTVAVDPGFWA